MVDKIIPPRSYDPDLYLLQGIASGDVRALDELYARYGSSVLGYLISLLSDQSLAEEVLQDVMLAVWNNAANFRAESSVRTWLLVIARNRAFNTQRRRQLPIISLSDAFEAHSNDTEPLEKVERKNASSTVRKALDNLPPAHREVLVLVFYHQLSGPEVAEVLGITTGTVKSRLHRAKEALRRVLGNEEIL